MDETRLILYLVLAVAAYGAAILAREDWRWNLGRILQLGLAASMSLGFALMGGRGTEAVAVSLGVLALLVLLPIWVRHRLWELILSGDLKRARRLHPLLHLACWGSARRTMTALLAAASHLAAGDSQAADDQFRAMLEGRSRNVRRRLLGYQLSLYLGVRRWEHAIALFEAYSSVPGVATATMLYQMVRAYAETGHFGDACWCLRTAESCGLVPRFATVTRLLAYTALFALTGRLRQLIEFFEGHKRTFRGLPKPFQPYWIGVCHQARGDASAAREAFDRVLSLCGRADETWRQAVQRRTEAVGDAESPEPLSAVALPEELQEELAALDPLARPHRTQTLSLFGGLGRVTAVLILLNVGVWLVMETSGSSSSSRDLVRFGANVPTLVKDGEYWRLVASMFIHVGLLHLLFNSYGCYLLGTFLERFTGSTRMFIIYMLSGLAGSVASAGAGRHAASAGASGAIFGLLGASIVLLVWRSKGSPAAGARGLHMPPRLRRLYAFNFIFLAALNLGLGLAEPQIDNYAHGGGFMGGILVTLVLGAAASLTASGRAQRPSRLHQAGVSATAAAMVLLLVYAGHMAAANVLRRGLPVRLPPLETRGIPDLGVRLDLPPLWAEVREADSLYIVDPLSEAGVAITRVPLQEAWRRLAEKVGRASPGRARRKRARATDKPPRAWRQVVLGDRAFLVSTAAHKRRGMRLIVDDYRTQAGDAIYILSTKCEEQNYSVYHEFFQRIVTSFELVAPPTPQAPAGAPRPPRRPPPATPLTS